MAKVAWLHYVVEAPEGARCSLCKAPVSGTDYVWRGHFPLLSDFVVEYAHPECTQGEGTRVVQELEP